MGDVLSREVWSTDLYIAMTHSHAGYAHAAKGRTAENRLRAHDKAMRERLAAAEAENERLRAALERLVEKCEPVLDNADGYDKSNFRGCILEATSGSGTSGAWSREELLDIEEAARGAWKIARTALTPTGESQP